MTSEPHSPLKRLLSATAALVVVSGCSQSLRPADASGYATMNCIELNELMSRVSAELSRTAINRGNVERTDIPTWVLGGRQVASKIVDRQTARIEHLREQERAIAAARLQNCGR
jgi:hypothetical protein